MIRRIAGFPRESFHLGLMLALTFSTGLIDAVGYLGLNRVFTGNMTGNVVILGMGVAGAEDLPVLGPLLALVGFMCGATFGGRVIKPAGPGWTRRTTVVFAIVAAVMLAVAVLLIVLADDISRPTGITITTILGVTMGTQAAAARFIAVQDVTTVAVTSTLTGIAADSVLGSGTGAGNNSRRIAVVLLLLAGAATGATLLRWHLGAGLFLAAVIALVVTVLGTIHARHQPPDPTAVG